MKIPLAWLQLRKEKIRLLIALAGISFADILMFMQLGFRDALFDSAVTPHKGLNGDIFLLSPKTNSIIAPRGFARRRLYQALAVEGVENAYPVYINFAPWKDPVKRITRNIMIIAINPIDPILTFPGVPENQQALKQEDTVLFDELSRSEFGPIASQFKAGKTVFSEVSAHKVKVAGLFKLGTSFGADGNIITSDLTYAKIFPSLDPTLISIGVIKLKPGADPNQVIASIREKLNMGDVKIFSRQEFIDYEIFYWQSSTAIGFIFTLGTVMGFIVGIVIVYQILYTDIANHLPEYATLKAMGYGNLYLLNIVFQEALILACLGYLPGLGLTLLLYSNTAVATGLPIMMTLARAISVLVLTIVMCCLSGSIAANRLRSADPADIF